MDHSWPQAILFDMDGLMLDSECLYQTAWKLAAGELGYQMDEALYLSLVGRSNAEAERAFVELFGDDFPVEEFGHRWEQLWQELINHQGIPLKPGLLELLDWLEVCRIPKAVGTSSNAAEAHLCLTRTGLWERFLTVVTVDQVGQGKPAPDIFLEAARQLGISPQSCLVLEDSNAGVAAANAGGMTVAMVPDLQTPTTESAAIATAIFTSLHEVLDWLSSR